MPRNRTYWNVLEAHIRKNPNDLLGMHSTIGANELRRIALSVARYAKIQKNRDGTIIYIVRKLSELRKRGFIESLSYDARTGLCYITEPIWSQLKWQPITADELSPTKGARDGRA
jgi:hypothetical protein